MFTRQTRSRTVSERGAAKDTVLRGAGMSNRGLRLRILQGQQRGHGGGIKGGFVILDVGDNKHSQSLRALLGRVTDAEEVLRVIRQGSPGCVSVTNANVLASEPGQDICDPVPPAGKGC